MSVVLFDFLQRVALGAGAVLAVLFVLQMKIPKRMVVKNSRRIDR